MNCGALILDAVSFVQFSSITPNPFTFLDTWKDRNPTSLAMLQESYYCTSKEQGKDSETRIALR